MLLHRFAELPIELYTRTRLLELADGEAVVRDEASGEERSLGRFESVIVAIGHTSYDPVSGVLRDAGLDVQVIGDACRPGRILDATRSGREAVVATGGE
jgi:uncharacterized FAD-dependent dehydrogenase